GGSDVDPRQRIGSDVRAPPAHFAPGDVTVAVGIEPDGAVEIAQSDVPAADDRVFMPFDGEVAVAGLVRGGAGRAQPQDNDPYAAHHFAPSMASTATSSRCVLRTQSA